MQVAKKTLDLEEELADFEQQVNELEARINEHVQTGLELEERAADPNDDLTSGEADVRIASLDEEVVELEASLAAVRGYVDMLERAIREWEGTEVTMKELTGQESRLVKAEAEQRAERLGLNQDKANDIRDIEFLKRALVQTPPGAPDPGEAHGLPSRMFDWLRGRANALNSVGDFDMGNSSLRERMAKERE